MIEIRKVEITRYEIKILLSNKQKVTLNINDEFRKKILSIIINEIAIPSGIFKEYYII